MNSHSSIVRKQSKTEYAEILRKFEEITNCLPPGYNDVFPQNIFYSKGHFTIFDIHKKQEQS